MGACRDPAGPLNPAKLSPPRLTQSLPDRLRSPEMGIWNIVSHRGGQEFPKRIQRPDFGLLSDRVIPTLSAVPVRRPTKRPKYPMEELGYGKSMDGARRRP